MDHIINNIIKQSVVYLLLDLTLCILVVSNINIYYLRYGEVYWTMMDPVPLDPDLVARFKDQTMAIVGYETDQG